MTADPQTASPARWAAPAPAAPTTTPSARRRTAAEIWIVLGLSLGQSGVYAIVNILARLSAETPLADQTATLNASQSERSLLDLTYQVLGIFFALVPVALALYLLSGRASATWRGTRERVGLDWGLDGARPGRDIAWGFGLAALIGLPGIAFYLLGRVVGITVQVQASALDQHWWVVPVLVLAALQNGLLEEVVAVAYLHERTRDLGWSRLWFVVTSSLLRGSYHLYQGIGPFLGNVVMGLVFSWFYTSRWGRNRVLPLVVAHTLLDVVAFVGYALLPAAWKTTLGL
ncbi:CPBP family intramembrane metalloprotease [Isoptericola sp. NEAU-Y5]|uniref:CPBP family intramembrane metalloprotease n=1 Tax=Isoptericola luteus TaxID=2879484 RepID=A0ABS7ZJ34_9MICO|nr:CPBP family intramembrane glutamic endopeptidase [Isoptericola sp. NEAU-Y5]MCA5894492.1 CPBP family intramembrane metalloprotease [Isoptericola sp. NEAU-Y5]